MSVSAPEKLTAAHVTSAFDCGVPALNEWLHKHAPAAQAAETCRSYVLHQQGQVLGFYSLAVGALDHVQASTRVGKGVGRYPIPVMILARLAVDVRGRGQGWGAGLLKDAILRTVQAADLAGIRAVLVHAKDEAAQGFYRRFEFEPSPVDPLLMLLLIKDARRALGH